MAYSYLAQCYMEENELSGHSRSCAYGAGADCTCGVIPPCYYGDGWCNRPTCEECVNEKLRASWCPRLPSEEATRLWWEEFDKNRRQERGELDEDIPF